MQTSTLHKIIFALLVFTASSVLAQDELDDFDKLLNIEVENPDPSYMPVVGVGVGVLNYFGDIQNNYKSANSGELGYKVNVSAFLDNNRILRGNLYFIYGQLSGNQRDYENLRNNFNFYTEVNMFGVNVDYDFDPIIAPNKKLRPFISIGFENILFNSKTDSLDAAGNNYIYQSDGTISTSAGRFTQRDFVPDHDLKASAITNNFILAVPLEVGLDFQVADRFILRLATSAHYTTKDYIDQITGDANNELAYLNSSQINDIFTYSYVSLNFDFFSDDKMITMRKMMLDVEDFDYDLMGDADGDIIFDIDDQCWDTPFGVEVDSVGCPFDDDNDGVPNYKDKQKATPRGAYVDEDGVEIPEDALIAMLDNSAAVRRDQVELFLRDKSSYDSYYRKSQVEIPEKFKFLDTDLDDYISFDEMLDAIDLYFDFEADLTSDDIYELNSLFFSQ